MSPAPVSQLNGFDAYGRRRREAIMTKEELDGDRVFVIHDFLSRAECAGLIGLSEGLGWEVGTLGDEVVEQVRNNERVLFDQPVLAAELFDRARQFLPVALDGRSVVGFNERWRFYRYVAGQAFKPHRDGAYVRIGTGEESRLTFMVYLNEGATGGETRFFIGMEDAFQRRPYLSVTPKEGMALVFLHRVWHEGAVVEGGQKYVLRTDVMYRTLTTL
jgi:prolyl 4-hydroxylase